jgi:hypothetical protein
MSENLKHTAGPWKLGWPSGSLESDSLRKTGDGVPYRVYHTVDGVTRSGKYAKGVAHIYLGEYEEDKLFKKTKPMLEEQLANALLIAAAPQMYEALKKLAECSKEIPLMGYEQGLIDKAIAKAETIPEGVRIA